MQTLIKYLLMLIMTASLVVTTGCEKADLLGLSNSDIIAGLKEALNVGTNNAVVKLSATDGYFLDRLVKIPFPPEAENAKNVLIQLGMESTVNDFVLKLNRAAEDAAPEAKQIFLDAILAMTIQDGNAILRGDSIEATRYLQNKTSNQLASLFKPKIQASLEEVGAQQLWADLTSKYNSLPLVQPVNTDLAAYTTDRALAGLFIKVGQEETKIRKDPAARVTDLLKKVFGNNP
ncbi:MAG: DUF4197 domain-containing protein [Bacteroidia bacterium]|nr:DUF4197 domain-containing protein [Bacteroidia bacterium]